MMPCNSKLRIARAAAAAVVMLICAAAPVLAQSASQEEMDPDEAGAQEMLNAQLWEQMKHTPYSDVKAYLARHRSMRPAPAAPEDTVLPTGFRLSPVGTQVDVGRLPYECVSYGGNVVVLNNGYYVSGSEDPEVSVVDPRAAKVVRTFRLPSLYPSAVVGSDGDLYISGGFSKQVYRLNSKYEIVKTYAVDGFAGGIAVVDRTHIAVSALVTAETKEAFDKGRYGKGSITLINTETGEIGPPVSLGYFPFAIACRGGHIFAALLGEDRVLALDAATLQLQRSIPVGKKPQSLALDGDRLYVVNSNSDSVSVIDTRSESVTMTIRLRALKTESGAAPISCAVDSAAGRLYVTLANLNQVAVLDSATGKPLGAIPTGWYPTKVLLGETGLTILNAKGVHARRPNPNGPQPVAGRGGTDYVLNLLYGSVQFVRKEEAATQLNSWTRAAEESTPRAAIRRLPHVSHIFYIVRENRTYDQVMGDIPKANGDINLNLFGQDITPNAHRIADAFVTLDNYFADGEISVLGHSFTTSGYASPFLEWLGNASYSDRYSGYPFGMVPSVTSPTYLWDALDKKGLDYRIYGENYFLYTRAIDIIKETLGPNSETARKFYAKMMQLASVTDRGQAFYSLALPFYGKANTVEEASVLLGDDLFVGPLSRFLVGDDSLAEAIKTRADLRNRFAAFLVHYPFNYRSWDLKTSDLDRVKAWKADFESQLKSGTVPALHYIWLPNDHTGGSNKAYLPPDQLVAQNDAALGMIMETLSHSPIWKQSLVLVTEDDAQNGPDHVDATRTVALAAGPGVKRGAIVSYRYDQLSLLRTIELVLGLAPMNRADALAVPMFGIFASKPDARPYDAIASNHLGVVDAERLREMRAADAQPPSVQTGR